MKTNLFAAGALLIAITFAATGNTITNTVNAISLPEDDLTAAELVVAEARDTLARNRTKIELVANNITLFDAILRIKNLSKANIVFSYMESGDRISETVITNSALNVAEIQVKANAGAASKSRRVTYATSVPMEWRTVLASILAPDYTFDEVDGMVRIATKKRFEELRAADNDAKPMGLRYIRVYNAAPEEVVERLKNISVLMSSKGSLQIAPYKEKVSGVVNSFRHNLTSYTTSGQATRGGTSVSVKGSSDSGAWGNLLRPRNPPAILAYDAIENLDKIEEYVRMMDVREKQVLIEALILELTDVGEQRLGMNIEKLGFNNLSLFNMGWNRNYSSDNTKTTDESSVKNTSYRNEANSLINKTTSALTGSAASADNNSSYGETTEYTFDDSGSGKYTITRKSNRETSFSANLGPINFNFVLSMIEEEGNGKILSSPIITIGDHSEAMIHVGNITPIANVESKYVGDLSSSVAQSVSWLELVSGIMMWVGPEITGNDNLVRLWVHPKISEETGEKATFNGISYPELQSQEIDTRVTIPSGDTLMIGGLTRNIKQERVERVPFFGYIPLLGRLFRHTETVSERRNLVILIRPTILADDIPDTGFEDPTMKIIDPMLEKSGPNIKDVNIGETDPMLKAEKAIVNFVTRESSGEDTKGPLISGNDGTAESAIPSDAEENEE